jgi:4-amino-4-deoxy-L-arabinose transferase-like glycosyltransferase
MDSLERLSQRWLPLLIFLAALLLRALFALVTRFDGLYGQDAYAYFDYSLQLRSALLAFQPPPSFFWPIGYPLPVALATFLFGLRPLAGQIVSLVGGALAAALVALMVAGATGKRGLGAVVAGLLAACASQATISSLSVMSDAAGLAWITLSAWAMLRYCCGLRRRWLALAAFALGAAVLTRWVYALAALPWALVALLACRRAGVGLRGMAGAAALAVVVGGLVVGSQFALDLGHPGAGHTGDLQVVGWNPANAVRSTIQNSDGVFHYERPIGLFYALPVVHPAFVFPLLAPFGLLGLWRLRRPPWSPLALLAGWPLVVYLFLAGIAWENPRFSLAFFPPLAVLVGIGVDVAWGAVRGPRGRTILLAACALGLAGSLAWAVRDVRTFVARKDADLAAARWVEAHVPPGATVITFGLTDTLRHYTGLHVVELYNETPDSLAAQVCGGQAAYLYVDVANIEAQWAGKSPEVNLRWLRDHAGIVVMNGSSGYTLFSAGGQCT